MEYWVDYRTSGCLGQRDSETFSQGTQAKGVSDTFALPAGGQPLTSWSLNEHGACVVEGEAKVSRLY